MNLSNNRYAALVWLNHIATAKPLQGKDKVSFLALARLAHPNDVNSQKELIDALFYATTDPETPLPISLKGVGRSAGHGFVGSAQSQNTTEKVIARDSEGQIYRNAHITFFEPQDLKRFLTAKKMSLPEWLSTVELIAEQAEPQDKQESFDKSEFARRGADARHAKTRAVKAEIKKYWHDNIGFELSADDAATRLEEQFKNTGLAYSTFLSYVKEARQEARQKK